MLDPTSDLNHYNNEFPLMSNFINPNGIGIDNTPLTNNIDDSNLINNFIPTSPSISTNLNNNTNLNNLNSINYGGNNNLSYNNGQLNNGGDNIQLSNGLNINAGNLYEDNQSLNTTANNINNINQFDQSQYSNDKLINNHDYYSSNDFDSNSNSNSINSQTIPINQNNNNNLSNNNSNSTNITSNDSSLFSSSSILDNNNIYQQHPNSMIGNYYSSQSIQPTSTSLISVNSYDQFNNQSSTTSNSNDLQFTPPNRNQNVIDYGNYYNQSLPINYQKQQQQQVQQVQQHPQQQVQQSQHLQSIKKETSDFESYESSISETGKKRYRVIRGVSAGGCSTRPPKQSIESDSIFLPVQLNLHDATVEDICYPKWSISEKLDRRRIIRIERIQNGPKLTVNFSIVGSANENPIKKSSHPDIDVVEVSCLECSVKSNDDYDSQSSDDEKDGSTSPSLFNNNNNNNNNSNNNPTFKSEIDGESYQYYITSVEVVEIVELLIGTQLKDPAERRRERGRVRSNLVPFWSKKSISSRMDASAANSNSNTNTNSGNGNGNGNGQFGINSNSSSNGEGLSNHDYRIELAKRIMGYEIRKPRGFDKDVRILRWDKLVPALKRALQSYYTEIPQCDSHIEF